MPDAITLPRAERERLRALAEAVVEAARAIDEEMARDGSETSQTGRLRTALYQAHLNLRRAVDPDVVLSLLAALDASEREGDPRMRRILDVVNAKGTRIEPSTLNAGRVVVVNGLTGADACDFTALDGINSLLDEEDGLVELPRMYFTLTRLAPPADSADG